MRSGPRRALLLLGTCAELSLIGFSGARVRADTSQVSFSSTDPNSSPQVNSSGLLAWTATVSGQPTVCLWNNGITTQLGSTTLFESQPNFCLSNSGDVVYQYQAYPAVGTDAIAGSEIYLWDGSPSLLSPHATGEGHIYPVINSSNQCAWVHVYYPAANQNKLSFDIQFWNGSLASVTSSYVPNSSGGR